MTYALAGEFAQLGEEVVGLQVVASADDAWPQVIDRFARGDTGCQQAAGDAGYPARLRDHDSADPVARQAAEAARLRRDTLIAALLAAGTWLLVASQRGWPVSTTHSIVGAIVGFAVISVGFDAVKWSKVGQIVLENHLKTCVTEAMTEGKKADREEKLQELVDLFRKYASVID